MSHKVTCFKMYVFFLNLIQNFNYVINVAVSDYCIGKSLLITLGTLTGQSS